MKLLKRNAYVIFTFFVLLLSVAFAAFIYLTYGHGDDIDTTSVGYFSVSVSESKEQQKANLTSNIDSWKQRVNYEVEYQGIKCKFDINVLDFDSDKTISSLVKNKQNKAYFQLNDAKKEEFKNLLKETYGNSIYTKINLDGENGLFRDLMSNAELLKTFYSVDLHPFVYQNGTNFVTLSEGFLTGVSEANIDKIMASLSSSDESVSGSFEIVPGKFSMLKYFADSDLTNEQLSIIATGLANIIVESSFLSVEVEKSMLKPFCDSTVAAFMVVKPNNENDKDTHDLSFYNPETYSFTVELVKSSSDTINFKLNGDPYVNKYVKNIKTENVDYKTTEILDPTIAATYNKADTRYSVTYDDALKKWKVTYVEVPGVIGSMVNYNRDVIAVDGTVTTVTVYTVRNDYVQEVIRYCYVLTDISQLA